MRAFQMRRRVAAAGLIALVSGFVVAATPVRASLQLADGTAFVGRGGYSADALGQNVVGGAVQAEVPANSAVAKAYLYGSYYFTATPIPEPSRQIMFDGTLVTLTELTHAAPGPCCSLRSARADVTSQVASKVGTGGGITDFVIGNDPSGLDGVALVVIYQNLAMPETTIAVMDGGAEQTGDTTTFDFLTPINKSLSDFKAILSLGSGFSYQGGTPGHGCGTTQFSTVDVNGERLTSCAGHWDDGVGNNGGLITVGGIGDSTDNPADPFSQGSGTDDELYDIDPFIDDGSTHLEVVTSNPSGDDILFLAVISVTGRAAVGCVEDGLNLLHDTPAEGAASGVVHDVVEPAVTPISPELEMLVHQVNCQVVVPVEDAVDTAGIPPLPPLPPLPTAPGLPGSAGFADGFEQGQGDWTIAGTAGWAVGAPASGPGSAAEGTNVAATVLGGSYSNNVSGTLTSPTIDLRGYDPADASPLNPYAGKSAMLRFKSWHVTEGYYDCGQLSISADGGPFAKVTPVGGYPYGGNTLYCGPGAFSGSGGSWNEVTLDLTSFATKEIDLQLLFRSDGSVVGPGWYVDDFRLSFE